MRKLLISSAAMLTFAAGVFLYSESADVSAQTASVSPGIREAVWFPDGKHIVVTLFDQLWTMTPEGKEQKRLNITGANFTSERDPAVSPDGKVIAFAGEVNGKFSIWKVAAGGGTASQVANTESRWPSFRPDGTVVSAHPHDASERQPRVSPDGKWVAFVSDRESATGEIDIWVRGTGADPKMIRVTKTAGAERSPTWSPDSKRIAYSSGLGDQAAVWVVRVPTDPPAPSAPTNAGRGFGGRGSAQADPADSPVLASKHGGVPAWSPDGNTLLIASHAPTDPGYNGDPLRNDDDVPMLFADAKDYTLWRVDAPRAVDSNAATVSPGTVALSTQFAASFDRVWTTLKSLYYSSGESATKWDALKTKYRGDAAAAKDAKAAEDVLDKMIAEQPLIKRGAEATRAAITSGHPLASAAGAEILAKGGNLVDAAIAVDFALGLTEPEASGLGGDGMALLFLKGMSEPIAIDFKDMTPGHATNDNAKLFNANGTRTAGDGPSVVNIPGIVAGMDLLYTKYGSKKVSWADILAPAIKLAEEGYILDESLPTSIAEGRASFAKYPESAKIYLPGGKPLKPGDRFVNKDYAETLRTLAKEGGRSFYNGSIAKRIADDFAANGGVITLEDLAQYRAIERKPVSGTYRGHLVYSAPPPVSNGADMIEKLQILNNFTPKPGASYANDADFLHYAIESWRVKDAGVRIADPDRWPIDLGNHLEPGHALERFKLLSRDKTYVGPGGGRGGNAPSLNTSGLITSGLNPSGLQEEDRRIGTGTTSFALADTEGNMIVVTQTLSTWGGSYYVSKDLGFLYNDHFRGGRGGTGYGATLPLMRSSSTSVPTMLFAPQDVDAGRYGIPGYAPKMAVGCAGNSWIPASVYNIILNVIDAGMDAQHAIEAPRIMVGGAGPNGRPRTTIEDRISRTILADLEARGHSFVKNGRKGEVREGYAAVVIVNPAKGTVEAGAEPRRSHGAVGIQKQP